MKNLFGFGLLSLLWVFILTNCGNKPKQLLSAIPENSAVVVYAGAFEKLKKFNRLDSLLPEKSSMKDCLLRLESLNLGMNLADKPAVFVPDRTTGLLILDISGSLNQKDILSRMKALQGGELTLYHYKGKEIYAVSGKEKISVAFHKNLLLLSSEAFPIEAALDQIREGSIGPFVYQPDQEGITIYIQPKWLPALFAGQLSLAGEAAFKHFEEKIETLIFNWQEPDSLYFTATAGLGNGFPALQQSTSLDHFSGMLERMPFRSGQLMLLNLDLARMRKQGDSTTFSRLILPWMGHKIGVFKSVTQHGIKTDGYVLNISDKALAESLMAELGEEMPAGAPYDYGMFTIHPITGKDLFLGLPGNDEDGSDLLAYVMLEDCVVFAGSAQELELILEDIIVGNTRMKDEALLASLGKGTPKMCGVSLFEASFLGDLFSNESLRLAYGQMRMTLLFSELDSQRNAIEIKGMTSAAEETKNLPGLKVWSTRLQAEAISPPVFIKDRIFILDQKNILYALDLSGTILWEKQLEGPMLGKIQHGVVEGKTVLFFNTAHNVSALDLSGDELPGFPIMLKEVSTQAITLVDFEHNGRFSFFVPCGDKIFGFEYNGIPIVGWNPLVLEAQVLFPFDHFQYGGNDYIFTLDSLPQLLVLDRFGTPVFPPIPQEGSFSSPPFYQLDPSSKMQGINRIVAGNDAGKILVVNPDGTHFNLRLKCGNNKRMNFVFADFTGDERMDYLASSGQNISLSGYESDRFFIHFEVELPVEITGIFGLDPLCQNKAALGVFSAPSKKVYLLNPDGSVNMKFPLAGNQPFTMAWNENCREIFYILVNGSEVYAVR
ncbi:MAG: PQQ-binding-like beta-propeller repeat protein [Saprospiraceae bacterium]|nr:PQQ-binding-like beta-propeller repeat protein [Saprospiraceae bacterium]MCB9322138.1 PQQ-binding-like beta-propeller repeat protein [Lewinellaceae bacterium]